MRLPLVLLSLIVIAGCAPEKPAGDTAPAGADSAETRFPCGSAEIRLPTADVGTIEEAFGADGIGEKVCAIFADAAGRAVAEPETVTATLPTGRTVTAQAVAAPAAR